MAGLICGDDESAYRDLNLSVWCRANNLIISTNKMPGDHPGLQEAQSRPTLTLRQWQLRGEGPQLHHLS